MFHGLVQVESKERRVAHRQTAPQLPPDEGRRRLNPFQGTLLRGCIAHHAEEDECAAQVAGGVYLGNGYYSPKSGVLDLAEDYLTDFLAQLFIDTFNASRHGSPLAGEFSVAFFVGVVGKQNRGGL